MALNVTLYLIWIALLYVLGAALLAAPTWLFIVLGLCAYFAYDKDGVA